MRQAALVVNMTLREDGSVHSSHGPLDSKAFQEISSWPSGGLVHMAHALIAEAIKRETYTMAISAMSTGISAEDLTLEDIESRTRAHLAELIDKAAKSAAEDVLASIRRQTPG